MSSVLVLGKPWTNGQQTVKKMTRASNQRQKRLLTVRDLSAMLPGDWLSDPAERGAGRLEVLMLQNRVHAFYFRYTSAPGKRDRLPLGSGLTLADARDRAAALSRRYQDGARNLRGVLTDERRDVERQRRNIEAEEQAERAKDKATLGALLCAYVAQLRRDGKTSAASTEGALRRHVQEAWPALWGERAELITMEDCLSILGRIVEAGKLREAAKVRSYMSAAFAAAIRSRQDARGLAVLRELGIRHNPVRDTVSIEGASNARDRVLSVAEVCAYWKRISSMQNPSGAILRFHLLTGGQRIEQLARVTLGDIDRDMCTMTLRDFKGRRRKPRAHVVPLIPAAVDALDAMGGGAHGEFAFSVDGGFSGAVYHLVQSRLREVVDAMAKAGELQLGAFTPGDLRRTVETRLAAAGVSDGVRGHVQSHGLGGVQSRHYDRHDYNTEKRTALETLHRIVTAKSTKVVEIKRRVQR